MKRRKAESKEINNRAVRRMVGEILSGETGVLYIIPTTAETLSAVSDAEVYAKCCVVATEYYFNHFTEGRRKPYSPVDFMRIIEDEEGAHDLRVIIFTDQFVSAEHAPLLVQENGKELFFPVLEVLAVERHGFSVACWSGNSFSFHAPSPLLNPREGVLRALLEYYEACNLLGDAWLARNRQYLRSAKGRIEEARERIRIYQSVVMLSANDQAGLQLVAPLLRDLAAVRDRVPRRVAG